MLDHGDHQKQVRVWTAIVLLSREPPIRMQRGFDEPAARAAYTRNFSAARVAS